MLNQEEMLTLLTELIACHSPPGDEHEIDPVIRREFESTRAEVWQDDATNLYARLPGQAPKVMICAHKDELGMVVTEVLESGRLRVQNCGGSFPWKYGEGPVDILADDGQIVRAILSVGSVHTSTGPVAELRKDRALTWDQVTLFTGIEARELAKRGVHVGSRAVVSRERKRLHQLGDKIASFALDDRLGLVCLITTLGVFAQETSPLDLYFVATSGEEVGILGAKRAAQLLAPDVCVALDTSPVAHGTPLELDARPVIWYGEAAYHNKSDCDLLLHLADELEIGAQPVVYSAAASDAGHIKRAGLAGRTATVGFARENSHGFEIASANSLPNVTRLLIAYLTHLARP